MPHLPEDMVATPVEMPGWEKRFDEKRNELRNIPPLGDGVDSEIVEFGYKTQRGNELFSVVDWGNIKAFIASEIATAYNQGKEEVVKAIDEEKRQVQMFLDEAVKEKDDVAASKYRLCLIALEVVKRQTR